MKRKGLWIPVGVLALTVVFGAAGGQFPFALLFLLCPLLHLFGMHRHGDHAKGAEGRADAGQPSGPASPAITAPERPS